MSNNSNENKELNDKLDSFLGGNEQPNKECNGNECQIKTSEGLIERVDKKLITNDGRELLMLRCVIDLKKKHQLTNPYLMKLPNV